MGTNTQTLDTLANELWDFAGVAADHDLPPLWRVELDRYSTDRGWRARAMVEGTEMDSAALYTAVAEYARFFGAEVMCGDPYRGALWPSGKQRKLTVTASYMGVSIDVYALVDGEFEAPGGDCAGTVVSQESMYSDPAVRAAVHAVASGGPR